MKTRIASDVLAPFVGSETTPHRPGGRGFSSAFSLLEGKLLVVLFTSTPKPTHMSLLEDPTEDAVGAVERVGRWLY